MDDAIKTAIEKIKKLSAQNPEFDAAMRELFGTTASASAVSVSSEDSRINEIYEYCIEKVIREQAEQFYSKFPIRELVPDLIEDMCRMERYKRDNNFNDFCLAAFQQVENIVNWFCQRPKFIELYNSKMNDDSTVNDPQELPIPIGRLIVITKYEDRYSTPLMKLYFNERLRAVLFFVYFQQKAYSYSFHTKYKELNSLYQCRNLNHRGGEPTPLQEEVITQVQSNKYQYYLKFSGLLVDFVEHISEFMAKKEESAVVSNALSGAVFFKTENGDTFRVDKGKLYYKVKNFKSGDKVIVERNRMTGEMQDISLIEKK